MLFFLLFLILFFLLWGVVGAVLPRAARTIQAVASRVTKLSQRFGRVQRFFTYASKWRDYFPVALVVGVGLVATLFVTETFVDIAELVHKKSTQLQQLDAHIHDWAVTERRAGATPFFVAATIIGGPAGVTTILVVVAIVLAVRRRWRWLAYIAITAGGGGLLNLLLKQYFERARPDVAEMLRRANGYSFPSGHAMGSTVAFGALAYLAYRVLPRWRWRAAAIALAIDLVAAVAASRVYLGVHWLSDVGAGIFAGVAWITAMTVAYETFRRIRGIRLVREKALQERTRSSNLDGARGA